MQKTIYIHEKTDNNYDQLLPITSASNVKLADNTNVENLNQNFNSLQSDYLEKGQDFFQVGDIKLSMKTDLGEKWFKCDGSAIEDIKYRELMSILGDEHYRFDGVEEVTTTMPSNFYSCSNFVEVDNYIYVVVGMWDDLSTYLVLAFIPKEEFLTGTWAYRIIAADISSFDSNYMFLIYANNQWSFATSLYNEDEERYQAKIYYSNNSINWQEFEVSFSNLTLSSWCYTYQNNNYIFLMEIWDETTSLRKLEIATTTDISSNSWNINELVYQFDSGWKKYSPYVLSCCYFNNAYHIHLQIMDQYNSSTKLIALTSPTLLTNNWQIITIENHSSIGSPPPINLSGIAVFESELVLYGRTASWSAGYWYSTDGRQYQSQTIASGTKTSNYFIDNITKFQGCYLIKYTHVVGSVNFSYYNEYRYGYSLTHLTESPAFPQIDSNNIFLEVNNQLFLLKYNLTSIFECHLIPHFSYLPDYSYFEASFRCNSFIKAIP